MGALRIAPSEFWRMSLGDLVCAIDGDREYNGRKPSPPRVSKKQVEGWFAEAQAKGWLN